MTVCVCGVCVRVYVCVLCVYVHESTCVCGLYRICLAYPGHASLYYNPTNVCHYISLFVHVLSLLY